ncbi:MAG TPA: hypothetical protein VGF65_16330 [Mycobacterium sp.]
MSAQPSAEYRRHHDVTAPRVDARTFRQGWRVRSRLDVLLADGAIDAVGHAQAIAFRDAWETAYGRSGNALMSVRSGGSTGPHDREGRRLDASGWLRGAALHLGAHGYLLVEACAVHDLSWPEIGRRFVVSHHTARSWTIQAINRLAARIP